MRKLIAHYYLRKAQRTWPQFRFKLHIAQSGSIYVQRKKHGYIDYVRIADHPHNPKLKKHPNVKTRTGWFQKRFFYIFIDIRKMDKAASLL